MCCKVNIKCLILPNLHYYIIYCIYIYILNDKKIIKSACVVSTQVYGNHLTEGQEPFVY